MVVVPELLPPSEPQALRQETMVQTVLPLLVVQEVTVGQTMEPMVVARLVGLLPVVLVVHQTSTPLVPVVVEVVLATTVVLVVEQLQVPTVLQVVVEVVAQVIPLVRPHLLPILLVAAHPPVTQVTVTVVVLAMEALVVAA